MGHAAKAWTALVLAFLAALLGEWGEGDALTIRDVVVAVVIAGGVYIVPNRGRTHA